MRISRSIRVVGAAPDKQLQTEFVRSAGSKRGATSAVRLFFLGIASISAITALLFLPSMYSAHSKQRANVGAVNVAELKLPTVEDGLAAFVPGYPFKPSKPLWTIAFGSSWFTGRHHWALDKGAPRGPWTCPASGCTLLWNNYEDALGFGEGSLKEADLVLYHTSEVDISAPVLPPAHPGQLLAMMAAETFKLDSQPESYFAPFHTEHTFRSSSWVRESYVPWFLDHRGHTLDITSMKPFSLQARVWADIWPDPIPTHQRKPMFGALTREGPGAGRNGLPLASWATHYCDGSKSRREAYVRELMQHIAIDIYGSVENCLANVPEELASADDKTQWTAQRHGPKFYLAFENDRCDDYVTEKFYWALLRGQVPIVLGTPTTHRWAPHPSSYIDVNDFPGGPGQLAQHLLYLDGNDTAYAEHHAWRHTLPFTQYGDGLRAELLEIIWIANHTTEGDWAWQYCRMCHGMERLVQEGKLTVTTSATAADDPAAAGTAGEEPATVTTTTLQPGGVKPVKCHDPWPWAGQTSTAAAVDRL